MWQNLHNMKYSILFILKSWVNAMHLSPPYICRRLSVSHTDWTQTPHCPFSRSCLHELESRYLTGYDSEWGFHLFSSWWYSLLSCSSWGVFFALELQWFIGLHVGVGLSKAVFFSRYQWATLLYKIFFLSGPFRTAVFQCLLLFFVCLAVLFWAVYSAHVVGVSKLLYRVDSPGVVLKPLHAESHTV